MDDRVRYSPEFGESDMTVRLRAGRQQCLHTESLDMRRGSSGSGGHVTDGAGQASSQDWPREGEGGVRQDGSPGRHAEGRK
jgi:hypothetical protein